MGLFRNYRYKDQMCCTEIHQDVMGTIWVYSGITLDRYKDYMRCTEIHQDVMGSIRDCFEVVRDSISWAKNM